MSFLLNVVDNYVTEVAASMLFGLGYYLVKGLKKKKEGEKKIKDDDECSKMTSKNSVKMKLEGALENWNYARSIEEYNSLIKENYGKVEAHEILNLIVNKGLSPNIDTYNALLLNCVYGKNFESARNLREEIMDPAGPVVPNTYTFNILIKALGVEYKYRLKNEDGVKEDLIKNFDVEVKKLIKSVNERNVKMDVIAHNTILDCLIDQGRLSEAWDHFRSIKEGKILQCDYYTYTTLLKGIRHTRNLNELWFDRAFQLLTEAKFLSNIEESFYNSLLDCCVKFDKIDIAERLFNNMLLENNYKLKEYSYSIMIKAYSKRCNLKKALEMFNLLKKVKSEEYTSNFNSEKLSPENKSENTSLIKNLNSPYPTTITYGSILNACIRCNDIYTAETIFFEMDRFSINKNAFIYSTMINGYRKSQNYLKAINLYEKLVTSLLFMDRDNCDKISKITFTNVLNSYQNCNATMNQLDEEDSLNIVIFNTILDCCIECEKFDKMEEVFEFLKNSIKVNPSVIIVPDIITYSIVIKGYAKANKVKKVLEIYEFILNSKKHPLDEVVYNTLLDCFARNGDELNMLKIFDDMRKKNIQMSVVTYGVIIKLYANLGDTYNANEVFEDLINKGIKPSVIIYQLLLRLYSRQKMPYKAVDVFRNMLLMKVKPDQIIYEYIINICCKSYYLKDAFEFLIQSIKDGFKLDENIFDYLVDCILHDNQIPIDERRVLLSELQSEIQGKKIYLSEYILDKISGLNGRNNHTSHRNGHKRSSYADNYSKRDYSYAYNSYNFTCNNWDNQSCFSSFNLKGEPKYRENTNNIPNKIEGEFEYEVDLNSNKEFFYPVINQKNDNKKYTQNYRCNKFYNRPYYQNQRKNNYNRNEEKSIYDL